MTLLFSKSTTAFFLPIFDHLVWPALEIGEMWRHFEDELCAIKAALFTWWERRMLLAVEIMDTLENNSLEMNDIVTAKENTRLHVIVNEANSTTDLI